jgi:two-component system, OmpR family, alkaline phosphatase synthesis response regulator PhoP
MTRILIVEDSADMAFGLATSLELDGHEALIAEDGPSGLAAARAERPDLIILDLMLPGMDGYRVLRTLREERVTTPVLILSARGEDVDKVRGFTVGADDYVTKPFSLMEVLARVNALLRRAHGTWPGAAADTAVERFGDVEVHLAARTVLRAGVEVQLAPKEFDLLVALINRRGGVLSRLEALQEVWGHRAAVLTRTVDVHVVELRRKLEDDPAAPRHLLTVRKAGYRLKV